MALANNTVLCVNSAVVFSLIPRVSAAAWDSFGQDIGKGHII